MATVAVTVYPSTTRIESADSTTGWSNDGGGGGVATEPDIVYQGTAAASRKVSTSIIGRAYTHGSGTDMDGTPESTAHYIAKVNAANSSALLSRSSPALHMKIGSSSSAYYTFNLFGNDNYPPAGGFQFIAIAPSVAGYRDGTTSTPTLSSILYWSILGDFSSSSKAENLVIDAIDVGLGLALVGGDGASADGVFADFITADQGTSGNRWGFVTSAEGVLFAIGELAIGRNSTPSAVATVFADSGQTVVWRNGLVRTGFNRLLLDLGGTGTAITMTNCSLSSRGQENNDGDRGYTTTEDSRTVLQVTGTTGAATLTGCVISNFAGFTLNNKVTLRDCTVTDCDQIDAGNGADLGGTKVSGYTGAANTSAILWDNANDPNGELDDMVITMGATATHAIEFGATIVSPMTLTNIDFAGFGAGNNANDSTFHFKDTTGDITLNLVGCTGNFSYRTDGANITIASTVTLELTNVVSGTTFTAHAQFTTATPAGTYNGTGDSVVRFTGSIGGSLPTSGNVRLWNGTYYDKYAYTGVSGTDLTGISPTLTQDYNGVVGLIEDMVAPTTITVDPYSVGVEGNQDFVATLAHASGGTVYVPIQFVDNTGSGFSRRIEQIED